MQNLKVKWPNETGMRSLAALFHHNRPNGRVLRGIFGISDEVRMPCANHSDLFWQNSYWEGFTQSHEVTNLFVWNFHGEIIHVALKLSGRWHDSKVAASSGLYYPKIDNAMTQPGYAIISDSAFSSNMSSISGKIIRARKHNKLNSDSTTCSEHEAVVSLVLDRILTSKRQSAE